MGKKIESIGNYALVGHSLGKGSFARVELGIHRYTKCKVFLWIYFFPYLLSILSTSHIYSSENEYQPLMLNTYFLILFKVAIKIIDTRKLGDDYFRTCAMRESKILAHLQHPNIVKIYDTLKVFFISSLDSSIDSYQSFLQWHCEEGSSFSEIPLFYRKKKKIPKGEKLNKLSSKNILARSY